MAYTTKNLLHPWKLSIALNVLYSEKNVLDVFQIVLLRTFHWRTILWGTRNGSL